MGTRRCDAREPDAEIHTWRDALAADDALAKERAPTGRHRPAPEKAISDCRTSPPASSAQRKGGTVSFKSSIKCNKKAPDLLVGGLLEWVSGGVLLSHILADAVPSALEGLASGFGMGPGVSPSLWPP